MALIQDLPPELVLEILSYVSSVEDKSCLSAACRYFNLIVTYDLFVTAFARESKRRGPKITGESLFLHAVKHDSKRIVQWLSSYELAPDLNRFVPYLKKLKITYLHLSLLGDAPVVATLLVKFGTDVWEDDHDYPGLTPLYLAMVYQGVNSDLDIALRIACSYRLPRTCAHLLIKGADPNRLSRHGLAPIHLAVEGRVPWRYFDDVAMLLNSDVAERYLGSHFQPSQTPPGFHSETSPYWNSRSLQTMNTLLQFTGNPNLRSEVSRTHRCGYRCWHSLDCIHPGQRTLHFVTTLPNSKELAEALIRGGADPRIPSDDGYLPVFLAMKHGHDELARFLLSHTHGADWAKAIVVHTQESTALHIACRFALDELVRALLEAGAEVNCVDVSGKTPLLEVLSQELPEVENSVVDILYQLVEHGANTDTRVKEGPSVWQMAAVHPFQIVRQMTLPRNNIDGFEIRHKLDPECEPSELYFSRTTTSRRLREEDIDTDSFVAFPELDTVSRNEEVVRPVFGSIMKESKWFNTADTKQRVLQQASPRGSGSHCPSPYESWPALEPRRASGSTVSTLSRYNPIGVWGTTNCQPRQTVSPITTCEDPIEHSSKDQGGDTRKRTRKKKWTPMKL